MRLLLRVALGVATIAFSAIGATMAGHAATLAAVKKAEQQFATLGANAYKTGQPPRMSDPKVKALLDIVFDVHGLPLTGTPPFSRLEALSQRMKAISEIGLIYTLAGTGAPTYAAAVKTSDLAKLNARVNRNTVTFAPEMGAYFDAEMVVEALVLKTVAHELQVNASAFANKMARRGLLHIRGGATQTIGGVFASLRIPGESDQWRRARMAALVAITPAAAEFLLPAQRKQLHDEALFTAKQAKDPILRAGYGGIAEVFAH